MTQIYYVERKADDLRTGNLFVDWAVHRECGTYPAPQRITNIRAKDGRISVTLADLTKVELHDEHICIVQEVA